MRVRVRVCGPQQLVQRCNEPGDGKRHGVHAQERGGEYQWADREKGVEGVDGHTQRREELDGQPESGGEDREDQRVQVDGMAVGGRGREKGGEESNAQGWWAPCDPGRAGVREKP